MVLMLNSSSFATLVHNVSVLADKQRVAVPLLVLNTAVQGVRIKQRHLVFSSQY